VSTYTPWEQQSRWYKFKFRARWKWIGFVDRTSDFLVGGWKDRYNGQDNQEVYDLIFWSFDRLADDCVEWARKRNDEHLIDFTFKLKQSYDAALANAKPRILTYYERKSLLHLINNTYYYQFHLAQDDDRAEDALSWLDVVFSQLKRDFVYQGE
jgi:hypothetical protein